MTCKSRGVLSNTQVGYTGTKKKSEGFERNQHQELTESNPQTFGLRAFYGHLAVANRFDDNRKKRALMRTFACIMIT